MEIKKLKEATKILEQIKELDKEIKCLDKLAYIVVNNEIESNLNLEIKDLTSKNKIDKNQDIFDSDGFIKKEVLNPEQENQNSHNSYGFFSSMILGTPTVFVKEKIDKTVHKLESKLSINLTGFILQVILKEKVDKKDILINKLKKLGVKNI